MCERKAWTKEEDQLLIKIMVEEGGEEGQRKLKWNDIASKISQLGGKINRKGKQCRERWFNQLHPDIIKQQVWLPEEEETLFSLQEQYGNHWAKISKGLPGRSDNSIKNYFYSCLRKALRKVNNYVYNNKRLAAYKNIKPFQKTTLSKILTVAQNKADNKVSISKEDAPLLARYIKKLLVTIQIKQSQDGQSDTMAEIVSKIQEFNRVCKRKKTKKKIPEKKQIWPDPSTLHQEQMIEEEDQDIESERFQQSSSLQEENQIKEKMFKKNHESSGSWVEKEEPQKESIKFLTSTSLNQGNKMRTEVVIPTCRFNSFEIPLLYTSQPISEKTKQTLVIQHRNSMEEMEDGQSRKKRPFLSCLPYFTSQFYHEPHYKNAIFPSEYQFNQNHFGYPLMNSSFSLCSKDGNGQRLSMFSSETKIRQQRSQSEGEKRNG